jgi:hypothetical protein
VKVLHFSEYLIKIIETKSFKDFFLKKNLSFVEVANRSSVVPSATRNIGDAKAGKGNAKVKSYEDFVSKVL